MSCKPIVLKKFTLGTIGGMGPLASSMFVNSLYTFQSNFVKTEQDYLKVISFSDPSIPDRTDFLFKGQEKVLTKYLVQQMDYLLNAGCDEIIILCFTMHSIIDKLPSHFQSMVRNLVTIALDEIIKLQEPILLLATSATYQFSIFEKNKLGKHAAHLLIKPDTKDQLKIHNMVYQLKFMKNIDNICEQIYLLVNKYNASGWMVGCTEFSLLHEQFREKYINIKIIDSLNLLIHHYTNHHSC